MNRSENKVYGVHACRALFQRRPEEIIRVYIAEDRGAEFADLTRLCAQLRKAYRLVPLEDLEKVTESRHHEGICVVVRARAPVSLEEVVKAPGPSVIMALVDLGNPHNVGAILRTAAHFGVRGVILPGGSGRIPPAAARTAQGGAEWIEVIDAPAPAQAFRLARAAGFSICATTSHGGRDLYEGSLPSRALLLVGAEDEGLPGELQDEADLVLGIPGSGHVESLNVSAAAAVVLAEMWRQHGRRVRGGRTRPGA